MGAQPAGEHEAPLTPAHEEEQGRDRGEDGHEQEQPEVPFRPALEERLDAAGACREGQAGEECGHGEIRAGHALSLPPERPGQ